MTGTTTPPPVKTRSWLPVGTHLANYQRSWLRGDIAAAVTVWAILVPESVAYAAIAGMPPQAGLYTATVPLLAYALLGSSRRITVGPSAAVAALSASAIAPVARGIDEFIVLSALLSLLVGAVLLVSAAARLGIIADFLSEPVLKGFVVGVALTIALGQSGKLLRVEVEGSGFVAEAVDLLSQVPDFHGPTLAVGLACLVALVGIHHVAPRVPAVLVVVVGAIVAAATLDLGAMGVELVGDVPAGLPTLSVPLLTWTEVAGLVPAAIGVAVVVYGESMALAKTFATRHRESIDPNQEMVALGAANVVGGLFGGFTSNASNSRSAASDASGQRTQVSSLILVLMLVLTLLFLTDVFTNLPEAALGAVVIHAVWGLIDLRGIMSLWARNPVDFGAALATLLGVLLLDVLVGLMIGVSVSLIALLTRAVRPQITWLGRDPVDGVFRDRAEHGVEDVDHIAIVRVGAELFFANIGTLRDEILEVVATTRPGAIVLDAEACSAIDTTAADGLRELADDLEVREVTFALARLSPVASKSLTLAGLDMAALEFPRVRDAVAVVSDEPVTVWDQRSGDVDHGLYD